MNHRIKLCLLLIGLWSLVGVPQASGEVFDNPDALSWSSSSSMTTPWSLYPTTINVPATDGTVNSLEVTFHDFKAGNLSYLNFMLVGPGGERAILMSDLSPSNYAPQAFELVFADSGGVYPSGGINYPLAGTTFIMKPFNGSESNDDVWGPPAPPGIGASTSLNTAFGGIDPAGDWSIYGMGNPSPPGPQSGQIGSGWSLDLKIKPPPPLPPPPPPLPVPEISGLVVAPARFRAANIGGSTIAAKPRRAPVGAKVFYRLSAAGEVVFSVRRLVRGVKRKGLCRKLKRGKKPHGRKPCTREIRLKDSFTSAGSAGLNEVFFTGRLANRSLAPSRYRLMARASADGSKFSAVKQTGFRIVR